ncbi:MAG TPA: hypothetical protein VK669_01385 [Candidatus Limnocylindrales bacterium]|nr:hypothetical protein [Candidatus Limnocylindrales bacterium]
MAKRSNDEIDIVDGHVRSFEWFWAEDGSMPGLDDFERLDDDVRAELIEVFRHWADLPAGRHLSQTRVNLERDQPKVFAVKAGRHRFTVFHAGSGVWVVHRRYAKRKKKLDRAGKRVIETTIRAMQDYARRVEDGTYYERE